MWKDKLKLALASLEAQGIQILYSIVIQANSTLDGLDNFVMIHAQELATAEQRGYFILNSDLADKTPILAALSEQGFSVELAKGTRDFIGRSVKVWLV